MCEWGDDVTIKVPGPPGERWRRKPVDRCMVPLIRALNRAGLRTAGACCGHGKGDPCVKLQDGREVIIREVVL